MSTNIDLYTINSVLIVYFPDGTSKVMENDTIRSFQLPTGGFCTMSDMAAIEGSEHPSEDVPAFAKKMIEFWQKVLENVPTATPI